MSISSRPPSFETLPAEVVVEVIANVEFTPSTFRDLHIVHKRLTEVLWNYQQSITKSITLSQFPNVLVDFPTATSRSYCWLSKCSRRYDVIEDITSILLSYDNTYRVSKHNASLVSAGFLLLYRLQDLPEYSSKVNLLKALPIDSLISIFLALFYCKSSARDYGVGMINKNYYHDIREIRSDIELVFTELGMVHGPQFLRDSLHGAARADSILLQAWHLKELGELPDDEGLSIAQGTLENLHEPYRRTISSHLREICAERMGCKQGDVLLRMLEMIEVPNHRLAWLCRTDRTKLVLGLPLDDKVRS
ncbi:hypothetical protein AOQ84DRAFT_43129 [Glonium stellatum]|uniref:F-box domain-containing protein n=1 Tax=Glonium stellatum TaxID=574774 RepID=A0A8E2FDU0_9PEZI|nr:hypothetical protein AOQ84DRAFT_43129 [Glonium stellatum]